MSCYACLKKFSFFTREYSCPNCGLSFCNKCLKDKLSLGDKNKNVCKNCFKKLTFNSDSMASSHTDIPELLVKRLETLENPAKPPITIFRHSNRLLNLKSGLSSKDKEILERLERLKAERTTSTLPDEGEIKRRLALLQDRSEDSLNENPKPHKFISQTEQEQVDDLLKQYMAETGLDTNLDAAHNQAVDEIRGRLKRLQTNSNDETTADLESMESVDTDAVTGRIIQRAIAEGQLKKRFNESGGIDDENDNENEINVDDDDIDISSGEDNNDDSEFPWCIICNENGSIKCFGCDGSLYCNTCFKQGHEFFNMDDHKHVAYTRKDSCGET